MNGECEAKIKHNVGDILCYYLKCQALIKLLYFKKNELNFKRQDEGYSEGTYQKVDDQGVEDNQKYVLDGNNDFKLHCHFRAKQYFYYGFDNLTCLK